MTGEEIASNEKEETRKTVFPSKIKNIFSMRSKVQGFEEENHPDKVVASRVCNFLMIMVYPILTKASCATWVH